ncbi:polysaccharide biosynthesis tyrosine autokinase [Leifsonia sp. NPDC058292]|uniref:polysaccharide biosynthesis tyrosine autokinase n=1 Tax=Leifsonia sp. NPDC058292 TaxID=3346428 RepID=UPI0036DD5861
MDLRDYVRVVRVHWMLIAVCALLGVAASAAVTLTTTPTYRASTQLYVSVRSGEGTADLVQGTTFARQAVTSYVSVVTSAIVLDRVIDELQLDTTTSGLAAKVSVTSPVNTVLIDIAVTDDDPGRAAAIANSVGENTAYVVTTQLERHAGGASPVTVQTVQPAVEPSAAARPDVTLNIALGLLFGLAVGVAVALLRFMLDTRIRTRRDVEAITDRPILGEIGSDPSAGSRPLIVQDAPRSPRAESFRSLRTNLRFINVGDSPRSYVITSSGPAEGKSTSAANLAISLAETGASVALVDGDLRLPKIAELMGVEGAAGLTDVLIGRAGLSDVLQRWGQGHLYVLPAGRIPPNPSELLGSSAMTTTLDSLTAAFDWVIVDSPPLLAVTDAAVISASTGGAILVAASGVTKKSELAAAVRSLGQVGSRLAGIAMTMMPPGRGGLVWSRRVR